MDSNPEPTRDQMKSEIGDLQRQGLVDRELIAQLEADGVLDRTKIAHMEVALITCRRIGAAMGIIMAQRKVTEEQAFDLMRIASQHSHRKLREVADDVVLTGTIEGSGHPGT
jgi:AmiR/NasT family two-component response regulator